MNVIIQFCSFVVLGIFFVLSGLNCVPSPTSERGSSSEVSTDHALFSENVKREELSPQRDGGIEQKREKTAPDLTAERGTENTRQTIDQKTSPEQIKRRDGHQKEAIFPEVAPEQVLEIPNTEAQNNKCLSHCDCAQGYDCISGSCKFGIKAKYCCENAKCPQSQPCRTRLGTGEFCQPGGTGQKVCKDYFGYCGPAGFSCKTGFIAHPQVSCGSSAQKCCLPPPQNTQCSGKGGYCISAGDKCSPHEQITKLSCGSAQKFCCLSKPVTTDCAKQSGVCYSLATACKSGYKENLSTKCKTAQEKCCLPTTSPQCQKDTDCPPSVCQQTPKGCAHTKPTCHQGMCQAHYKTAPGSCNRSTGLCE